MLSRRRMALAGAVNHVGAKPPLFSFFAKFISKSVLIEAINRNLEALAKQIYNYWFVQFDFPDENGKPYKSSGGEMAWNEKTKRSIPKVWEYTTLKDLCIMYQPQTLGLNDLNEDGKYLVYGANGIIGKYDLYNHESSEIAMACRGNSCGILNRTMPYSWITGNAMVIKLKDKQVHNEFLRNALSYVNVQGAITGSGQPQITRENLQKLYIIKPSQEILFMFSQKIKVLVDLQVQIEYEQSSLMQQREELLPLLMNGQINSDLSHIFLYLSVCLNLKEYERKHHPSNRYCNAARFRLSSNDKAKSSTYPRATRRRV